MRLWRAVAVWLLTIPLGTPAARAAPSPGAKETSVLARAFAPILVFHPQERYFPAWPLFPLAPGSQPVDHDRAATTLRTPDERVRRYDELPRRDQLAVATLSYRVFAIDTGKRPRVAVEYSCHYVFNDYTFHGGIV